MLLNLSLLLSILAGQLIKFPLLGNLGPTLLDFFVICFCLMGIFKLRFRLKNPPLFIKIAGLFLTSSTISLILTPLHLTKTEYLLSFFYTIRFSSYILSGWIIYSGAFADFKKNLTNTFLTSGVGLAILGLLQFIFLPDLQFLTISGWDPHYFRVVSTFLDPNFAGAYFVLTFLLLMSFKNLHNIRLSVMAIVYIALLATFSRSSYLMFLISGVTFSFLKKSRIFFLSVIILFFVLLLGFQIYTELVARPRYIDRTQSAASRVDTWQQGFTIFQKSPILGVGFNAYRYALKEYNLGDEEFIKGHGSTGNDSSLLFIASTTGIVGLSIYFIFLISLLKYSYPKNPALISAIVGLLIHSFFANSLFYPPILFWIISL